MTTPGKGKRSPKRSPAGFPGISPTENRTKSLRRGLAEHADAMTNTRKRFDQSVVRS